MFSIHHFLAVLLMAAVVLEAQHVPILKDDRTQDAVGGYSFNFETGNGIQRQESGGQNDGQVSEGRYSFQTPEGVPVEIFFVADHGGFRPQGAVIPVAPPLPYSRTGN